jgi:hypothetical protein
VGGLPHATKAAAQTRHVTIERECGTAGDEARGEVRSMFNAAKHSEP